MPAIISSSITPRPFFIFLSTMFIGKGFTISKNLNNIKEIIVQPKNGHPKKKKNYKIHVATKIFQSLRIFVNKEISELIYGLINATKILKPGGINIYTVRHTEDGDYKNGIHRGENLYENDGFIIHFFSKDKVNQLSKGFEILDIEKFEEGKFPRKLFFVKNRKI